MASLKETGLTIKFAFCLFLGTGKKDPLGPKLGSDTGVRTPWCMSALAIILPSSLAGRSRLNVRCAVDINEAGTSRCHIRIGMCIQPTGPHPR